MARELDDVEIDATDDETREDFLKFWATKQKELVTSVVDYNLSTLTDLINDKDIDLSPGYQRRNRWDDVRKSALIESFLINVPVPPVFLNEDNYGEYSIIDGKQRLTAIHEFMSGSLRLRGLKVYAELEDQKFNELPSRLQSVIRTRPTLRAVIVLRQSDKDVKFEVFRRLNTGGVTLNAQEIRNSVHTGSLNNMLLKLSDNRDFHRMLGIKRKADSKLYQEMGDVELILRYFAFRDYWRYFNGGIVHRLDSFMAENKNLSDDMVASDSADFLNTLATVEMVWGDNAFRRWSPETGKWRNQILASLFDAQMMACRGINPKQVEGKRDIILAMFKQLFEDSEFQKAISASISVYFKLRIEMVKSIITSVVE